MWVRLGCDRVTQKAEEGCVQIQEGAVTPQTLGPGAAQAVGSLGAGPLGAHLSPGVPSSLWESAPFSCLRLLSSLFALLVAATIQLIPGAPRSANSPSGALSLWSYISRRHLTMEFLFQSEAQSPCFRSSLQFGCTWARCSISSNQRAGGVGGPETQTSLTRPQPKHRADPEPMCQGSRQSERQEIDV